MKRAISVLLGCIGLAAMLSGCPENPSYAKGIFAAMGAPMPSATAEQSATFERGKKVLVKRFDLSSGLGPASMFRFAAHAMSVRLLAGAQACTVIFQWARRGLAMAH